MALHKVSKGTYEALRITVISTPRAPQHEHRHPTLGPTGEHRTLGPAHYSSVISDTVNRGTSEHQAWRIEIMRVPASTLAAARRAFVLRIVTLPVSGLAGLLAARATVSALGVGGFAVFALVVGLAALVPIGDLGVGAAVTDAVARRRELGVEGVQRVLRTSLRVLVGVAAALSVAAWGCAAMGWWAPLLGLPASQEVEVAVGAALTLFAAGLPLGLSSRVLLGAERNDIALAFQGGSGVLTLLIVLLAAGIRAPLWAFASAPSAGAALAAAAAWPKASAASQLSLRETVRFAAQRGRAGATIAHLARPMVVITAAQPIAFQSDRLLLSHLSTLDQVAIYALAMQISAPFLGLIWAAGMSLWPVFARRRNNQPVSRHELLTLTGVFSSVGALLAVVLIAAGPWAAHFVSKGQIHVGYGVFVAFGALLLVHASYFPTGMLLTDPSGLRFQAVTSVFMLVVNLLVSAVLALSLGAPGPILGSVLAIVVAMEIPGLWRAFTIAQK